MPSQTSRHASGSSILQAGPSPHRHGLSQMTSHTPQHPLPSGHTASGAASSLGAPAPPLACDTPSGGLFSPIISTTTIPVGSSWTPFGVIPASTFAAYARLDAATAERNWWIDHMRAIQNLRCERLQRAGLDRLRAATEEWIKADAAVMAATDKVRA